MFARRSPRTRRICVALPSTGFAGAAVQLQRKSNRGGRAIATTSTYWCTLPLQSPAGELD
jgi:hypothetical protein